MIILCLYYIMKYNTKKNRSTSKKNKGNKKHKRTYKKKFSTLVKHFKSPIQSSNEAYKKTKNFNKARIAALKRLNYNARNLFGQISTLQVFK